MHTISLRSVQHDVQRKKLRDRLNKRKHDPELRLSENGADDLER